MTFRALILTMAIFAASGAQAAPEAPKPASAEPKKPVNVVALLPAEIQKKLADHGITISAQKLTMEGQNLVLEGAVRLDCTLLKLKGRLSAEKVVCSLESLTATAFHPASVTLAQGTLRTTATGGKIQVSRDGSVQGTKTAIQLKPTGKGKAKP